MDIGSLGETACSLFSLVVIASLLYKWWWGFRQQDEPCAGHVTARSQIFLTASLCWVLPSHPWTWLTAAFVWSECSSVQLLAFCRCCNLQQFWWFSICKNWDAYWIATLDLWWNSETTEFWNFAIKNISCLVQCILDVWLFQTVVVSSLLYLFNVQQHSCRALFMLQKAHTRHRSLEAVIQDD